MGLPVGQVGCRSGKDFREKVIRDKEGSHARADGHASQVPQGTAANAAEKIVGQILRGNSLFAGALQNINLVVEVVVKVAGHGRWVDGADVDSQRLQFDVQAASQLTHKGFGSTVHARKGGWNETGDAGSEDDTSLLFGSNQFGRKVVGNVDSGSGIACMERTKKGGKCTEGKNLSLRNF